MTEAGDVEQKGIRGRNVVVKAVVDQATQRAVLLLADLSCLLVSLAEGTAAVPITVSPPCSSACFLRLQAYEAAVASSTTSACGLKIGSDSASASSKVDVAERGILKTGNGESYAPREMRDKESVGKRSAGSGRSMGQGFGGLRTEYFVVLSRPALGGSCTDLSAWSYMDAAFSSVDMELERRDKEVRSTDEVHNFRSSRTYARLDAPHGLTVKMVASINVLVVYSSSAGKFWVIAGRWSGETGRPDQTVMSKSAYGAGPVRKCLVLMKRAVLRCHGPVYSMFVSPLHLFLGESKGIRVWSLRPLMKPGSSVRGIGQAKSKLFVTPEQGSDLDCEHCQRGDRYRQIVESQSAAGTIHEKASHGNGAKLDATVDSMDSIGVAAVKKLTRKGLCATDEGDVGVNFTGIESYRKPQFGSGVHSQASSLRFWSLSELQEALEIDCSEQLPAEDRISGKTTTGIGVIDVENRIGASRSSLTEHGDFPIKMTCNVVKSNGSHGSTITSRPEEGPSNECSGNDFMKTDPRRTPVSESLFIPFELGGQPLASQLANENGLQQTGPSGHATGVQSKLGLESAGMCFVALRSKEGLVSSNCTSHGGVPAHPQVVDIQGLSLKVFAVLDSRGDLHLLTLHDVSEERKLVALFPILSPLQITMHVTSFIVPPLPAPSSLPRRDFGSPAEVPANRKLWISDGMYSVHTVILPEEKPNSGINSSTTQSTLAVSRAVFMKDRLDVLVSLSGDTVAVLTEGKFMSHVVPKG